jgi:ribosomal protein S8
MEKKITQRDRVLQYMRENNGITAYEAVVEVGCTQLSARICELQREGYMFSTELIKNTNRYGDKCHYLKYRYVGNINEVANA